MREFLGTAGYCRLGTPNFAEIAQWLCQSLGGSSPVIWEGKAKEKFQTLKEDWCQPPHLGCLTLTTPSTCEWVTWGDKKSTDSTLGALETACWSECRDPVAAG